MAGRRDPEDCFGGVAKETTGRIYQNDAWVDVWSPKVWLIKDGVETSVAGGYIATNMCENGEEINTVLVNPSVNKTAGKFAVSVSRMQANHHAGTLFLKNPVEITTYATLKVDNERSVHTGWVKVVATKEIKHNYINILNSGFGSASRNVLNFNISNYTGKFYVGFEVCAASAASAPSIFSIFNIELCK